MKRKIKPIEVSLDNNKVNSHPNTGSTLDIFLEEENIVLTQPEYIYPNVALGLHKVREGKYALVEIPYDPVSGDVGFINVLAEDVFEDAADRFKISAAEKLLTRSKD
jgi:hypothetical protein